jgi:hypothetical protein
MFHFSSLFASIGMLFSGMFGGHGQAAMSMNRPGPQAGWEASTTAAMRGMMANGVFGIVTAVNGDSITVSGRQGTSTATTTFTVDATNATIRKGAATSTASVSDISVGDRVAVQGAVSGDTVTATTIFDGMFMMRGGPGMGMMGSSTRPYPGRGPNASTTGPWQGWASSTPGQWHNGASSTPGMRHPTPGQPQGYNPGGPMIPAGGAGANVSGGVNVGY